MERNQNKTTVGAIVKKYLPLAIIIWLGLGLKLFYSRADAGDLRWILAPTARAVETVTGRTFVFDAAEGYRTPDHAATIAPVCAGVNFMIIIIVMTGILLIGNTQGWRRTVVSTVAVIVVAYAFTIAVNTVRIAIALALYDADVSFGVLTRVRLHRLAGIAVYFAATCAVYYGVKAFLRGRSAGCPGSVGGIGDEPGCLNRVISENKAQSGRQTPVMVSAALPVICYLGVTVGLPLLRGSAARNGGLFIEHLVSAFMVLAVAGMVVLVWRRMMFVDRPKR